MTTINTEIYGKGAVVYSHQSDSYQLAAGIVHDSEAELIKQNKGKLKTITITDRDVLYSYRRAFDNMASHLDAQDARKGIVRKYNYLVEHEVSGKIWMTENQYANAKECGADLEKQFPEQLIIILRKLDETYREPAPIPKKKSKITSKEVVH